jgi:hypothetical protein
LSTYLELTNLAILESGAEADELTSSDFASPTDSVQRDIKRWVAKAWKEIQMEINNWEFKSKQAQFIIRPRFLVTDGDRPSAPEEGSEFQGDDTDATFTVESVELLDGTWAAGTAVAIIEYSDLDGQFKWHEQFDEVLTFPDATLIRFDNSAAVTNIPQIGDYVKTNDGTNLTGRIAYVYLTAGSWAANTAEGWMYLEDTVGDWVSNGENVQSPVDTYSDDAFTDLIEADVFTTDPYASNPLPTVLADNNFRLKWWGRYNLQDEVTDLFEPITSTFSVQSTGGSSTQDNTATADNANIAYIPWPLWLSGGYEDDMASIGFPRVFTETPDGEYDFWPRPDQEYVLTFTYSANPQILSAHGDEVEDLPSQYHDMIAWRAVMYWADKNERPSQFARAERRYEGYMNRLVGNKKPKPTFGNNPFNGGY